MQKSLDRFQGLRVQGLEFRIGFRRSGFAIQSHGPSLFPIARVSETSSSSDLPLKMPSLILKSLACKLGFRV